MTSRNIATAPRGGEPHSLERVLGNGRLEVFVNLPERLRAERDSSARRAQSVGHGGPGLAAWGGTRWWGRRLADFDHPEE